MRIIITRSISIIPCVIVTLFSYGSLDSLNFWCNIVQAIQIPFALFPILHFTSSKRVMGSFRNNLLLIILCYGIALCVLSINLFFLINLIVRPYPNFNKYILIFTIYYFLRLILESFIFIYSEP